MKKKMVKRESCFRVTDHAILRYLERVKEIDIEEVRTHLENSENEKMKKQVKILGEGYFPMEDCKIYIQNNTVITVIA